MERREACAAIGLVVTGGCLRLIEGDENGASDGGIDRSEDGIALPSDNAEFVLRPDDPDSQTITSAAERNGRDTLDGRVTFNVWTPDEERLGHTTTTGRRTFAKP